ncbi:MAG: Ig-like domain-containing protein [Longimicrobiales bacterium]
MRDRLGPMALLFTTVSVALFIACDSGGCVDTPTNPCDPTVASIQVNPLGDSILVGATTQLTAEARDAAGNPVGGQTVTWSSSSDGVATVSAAGLVTGVSAGSATITASAGGITSAGAQVMVFDPVPVESVQVTPLTDSVAVGSTTQLTAVALDASQNPVFGVDVTWSSSSEAVARVSASGLVTGQVAGSATITASAGGVSGQSAITILPIPMVVSTRPADGDSVIVIDNPFIQVIFDHNLDFASIDESTFFLTGPDGLVPGGFSSIDPKRLRFNPDEPLTEFRSEYTLTVTTGVRDSDGVPLGAPVTVTFVTEFVSANYLYKLWNDGLGPDLVLDALAQDPRECIHADRAQNTGGSFWYFEPLTDIGGFFRIRNNREGPGRLLQGGDGVGPCVVAPDGASLGEHWTFEALGNNRFKIQSQDFGTARSLDNFNDARDPEQAYMAVTAATMSQSWAIERSNPR